MKQLLVLLLTLPFLIPSFSSAQTWQSVGGGLGSSTHCLTTWDGKLVVGGSFNNSPCDRIQTWDGTTYECLGNGVGIVARDAIDWNGNLVVVGDFWNNFQPCTGCNGIAMWDGTQWLPLGTGFNNDVLCLGIYNGQLLAGGDFTMANGVPCNRIARWTGTTWEQLGGVNDFDNDVRCIVEYDNELWIGGDFSNVGGCTACDGLVKYDDATNTWLGGNSGVDLVGGVNETIRVLFVNPNDGNLYLGGEFTQLHDGDAPAPDPNMAGIAMYDGSNWYPLGSGLNQYCRAIHDYNGNLIAGGWFTTAGGVSANRIAKWNGSTWSPMGQGFDLAGIDEYVKAAETWNGIFFAGGAYTQAEGNPMGYIAQWYEAPSNPPVAGINASTTSICAGSCISFSDNSTNSPNAWTWTFTGGSIANSSAQNPGSVCYNTPGTYTVSMQACNGSGCNTATMTVNVTAAPTVTVNNPSVCAGSSVTLTATPSTGGGSYLWSPGGQTTQSIVVSPGSTTNYTVTYTLNGCSSPVTTSTVTVTAAPTVTVNNPSICSGTSATITATPSTGGGSYLWSPGGQTTPSITVSPGSTTNYTVTYTLNGCSSPVTTSTVTVTAAPTVNVNNPSICAGNSTTITATPSTGGGSYLWSPGGQTTPSITVSPGSTTSYTVTYTLNGCASPVTTSTVTVTPQPTVTLNNASICAGASATLLATPSTGGGSYLWSPGGQTTQSIVVNPGSTTNYTVIYTLNGCSSPLTSTTVTVTAVPTVSVNNTSICAGQSATLTATPSAGGGNYLWNPGGATTNSISVNPSTTTTYSVQYTLNGCSGNQSATVTVNPNYNLNESTDVCIGSSYTFPDGTTQTINTNTVYTSSLTSTQGCDSIIVTTVNAVNALSSSETFSVCSGANYTYPDGTVSNNITVDESHVSTLTSAGGCDSLVTTYILVNPIPVLNSTSATSCAGESVTLMANGTPAGGSYLWSPGGQTTQNIVVNPSTTTSYTVTYTVNGCPSNVSTSTVTVNALPDNTTSMANNTITANQNGASYQWVDCNNGMSAISGATNQSFSPAQNGVYAVVVTLNACSATSNCVTINTIGLGDEVYEWLSIFPNPTGDYLEIRGGDQTEFTFRVLDAAGRIAMQGNLNSSEKLNVKALSPGSYLLELDGVATYRFVKE